MRKLVILMILNSCASYTNPQGERLSFYNCERAQVVAVKHSIDYQLLRIKVGSEQILLHHFVIETGEGYRNQQYLWITQGKKAKLIHLKRDGTEEILLGQCKRE